MRRTLDGDDVSSFKRGAADSSSSLISGLAIGVSPAMKNEILKNLIRLNKDYYLPFHY